MKYAVCCLFVLCVCACGKPAAAPAKPPIPVVTATANRIDLPLRQRAVGTAAASELVTVRPQISAMLASIAFSEGATVAAGAVLFRLDDRDAAAAVQQAEAVLARDRAQAAYAVAEAKRMDDLAAANLSSQQQAEQARAARDAARAAVAADEAALVRARLDLSYCTITAPIAGRTGALGITAGNLAIANQTALVTIARMQPMHVTFSLPANQLPALRAAQERGVLAVAAVPEGGGQASAGTLDLIDNQIDAGSASVGLRAACPNADARLWPGQQCQVELTMGIDSQVLAVPEVAVQLGQKGSLVWVVAADRSVAPRPVEVARTQDGLAVIAKGLEAGEIVVVDGQVRLTRGAIVVLPEAGGGKAAAR